MRCFRFALPAFAFSVLILGADAIAARAADVTAAVEAVPVSQMPAELVIRNALQQRVSVEFAETPLDDVIRFLGEKFKVQMMLDRKGLAEAGIATDTMVTLKVAELPLKSVLALVLEQVPGTTWTIRYGVLQVTSGERANSQLATKAYVLFDILGEDLLKEFDTSKLVNIISTHIAPDTWAATGGNGSISAAGLKTPVLVVTQSWQNHEAIAELFAQMKTAHRPETKPAPK